MKFKIDYGIGYYHVYYRKNIFYNWKYYYLYKTLKEAEEGIKTLKELFKKKEGFPIYYD